MAETYTAIGKLSNEKTVVLEKALPIKEGQVRVIVQPLSPKTGDFREKLAEIRNFLADSGYKNRTKTQIDADLTAERDAWDD